MYRLYYSMCYPRMFFTQMMPSMYWLYYSMYYPRMFLLRWSRACIDFTIACIIQGCFTQMIPSMYRLYYSMCYPRMFLLRWSRACIDFTIACIIQGCFYSNDPEHVSTLLYHVLSKDVLLRWSRACIDFTIACVIQGCFYSDDPEHVSTLLWHVLSKDVFTQMIPSMYRLYYSMCYPRMFLLKWSRACIDFTIACVIQGCFYSDDPEHVSTLLWHVLSKDVFTQMIPSMYRLYYSMCYPRMFLLRWSRACIDFTIACVIQGCFYSDDPEHVSTLL